MTDGLRAEREQGITIDVAYRYFATPKRKFIIADTPGHIQYTRNMVTGASTAQLVIVLVDARHGLLEQSRRHAFLASLLGIQHIVLAVNKMDLIGWDREKFDAIRDELHAFAARLDVHDVATVPISALHGDNVVTKSDQTPWYEGPALLSHLEEVYIAGDRNLVDVRFPVQYVIRPHTHEHQDHRSYAGTLASGVMRAGDEVVVLPVGKRTRITAIDGPNGPVDEAFPPMAVSLTLADEIDISRGDLIARTHNQPRVAQDFDATVCWMADGAALEPGRDYVIKHTTRTTHAKVTALDYRLDVNTLHRDKTATALKLNELGRISLRTQVPLLLDEYTRNPSTGSFILIDPHTNGTVAAGMVLRDASAQAASPNTVRHKSSAIAEARPRGKTVWFTGLSGSGKSSVAVLVEQKLLESGAPAYVLDGDNLRHGLNADLASAWPTGPRTCAGSRMWRRYSPTAATSCWYRRSPRWPSSVNWRAKCTPMPASTSSRCSATPRSTNAKSAIPRACTRRRARVRSRSSPASTARISRRRTRTCGSPRTARSRSRRSGSSTCSNRAGSPPVPPGCAEILAPGGTILRVRMSAKAEYAVRAMIQLATVPDGTLVKTDDLAQAQGIPPQFLVDILTNLRTDRLVRSHRGREGGYELARSGSDISIADVLRCIDGPLASVRDIGLGDLPYSGPTAALTDVWRALRASMRSVLEETTLADVATGGLPKHVAQLADDYRKQESQRHGTARTGD